LPKEDWWASQGENKKNRHSTKAKPKLLEYIRMLYQAVVLKG